jgi:hypothetical protein
LFRDRFGPLRLAIDDADHVEMGAAVHHRQMAVQRHPPEAYGGDLNAGRHR